jgi:DNA-binding response OmpR family regulator
MRILIVTTRPETFTAFAATLGEKGLETAVAPTGQAALDLARTTPPTLCVVDEQLPDTDPFALVAKLMSQNALIPTAVVSGLSAEEFHEAGEGLGILTALAQNPGPEAAASLAATLKAVAG